MAEFLTCYMPDENKNYSEVDHNNGVRPDNQTHCPIRMIFNA